MTVKSDKLKFPKPKLLTYDDYARLTPPDSGNYELHNGKIIYMPSPFYTHQNISMILSAALYFHVKNNKLGQVCTAPLDVKLTENDTVQPDILFIKKERESIIDGIIKGAPDLVVEILSPSNDAKEMSYKKYIYEVSGVSEYWVINLQKKILTQYENVENELLLQRVYTQSDILKSLVVDGFEMKLKELFE